MKIGFFGAARTVTGSRHLVDFHGFRVLVDCGLFQGGFELHQRNWQPLPFAEESVDRVVFTHAHIDHSGYFPRFVKMGFAGKALATPPTAALLRYLLPDSGGLQEEEARYANKKGFSRHEVALPLYTEAEAKRSLARIESRAFDRWHTLEHGVQLRFHRAGHILGAGFLEFVQERRGLAPERIVFSGDLGRTGVPILKDPDPLPETDTVVIEATYGDRLHEVTDVKEQLRIALADGFARGGVVLIPAFAVGRTQEILYHLNSLYQEGALPKVPVYVDSPMANSVVELYCKHTSEYDVEMQELDEADGCPLVRPFFHVTRTREESKKLNSLPGPAVIVSASGMATGGRILHHLARRISEPGTTVLFAGYQARGTLGRRLLEGAPEVRLLGAMLPVRAAVKQIPALSAHADADGLMAWLRTAPKPPKRVFLVHGEDEALEGFAARITRELGWDVSIPARDETVTV